MSTESASAIAGLVKTGAGAASTFNAVVEYGSSASDLLSLGQEESKTTFENAVARANAYRKKGFADLVDVSTLEAVTAAKERSLNRQGTRDVGTVIANAAGSGVELAGSPLLAALDTSTEIQRAVGTQELLKAFGVRRLKFAAEGAYAQAEDALSSGTKEAQAQLKVRDAQSNTLRRKQLRTLLGGIETALSPSAVKAGADLVKPSAKPSPGLETGF